MTNGRPAAGSTTDTVEQIDKALAAFPLDDKGRSSWDFEYRSSW
jgi:hypothetical protein